MLYYLFPQTHNSGFIGTKHSLLHVHTTAHRHHALFSKVNIVSILSMLTALLSIYRGSHSPTDRSPLSRNSCCAARKLKQIHTAKLASFLGLCLQYASTELKNFEILSHAVMSGEQKTNRFAINTYNDHLHIN